MSDPNKNILLIDASAYAILSNVIISDGIFINENIKDNSIVQ